MHSWHITCEPEVPFYTALDDNVRFYPVSLVASPVTAVFGHGWCMVGSAFLVFVWLWTKRTWAVEPHVCCHRAAWQGKEAEHPPPKKPHQMVRAEFPLMDMRHDNRRETEGATGRGVKWNNTSQNQQVSPVTARTRKRHKSDKVRHGWVTQERCLKSI